MGKSTCQPGCECRPAAKTTATLKVYADRVGIKLDNGSIEEWKRPAKRDE